MGCKSIFVSECIMILTILFIQTIDTAGKAKSLFVFSTEMKAKLKSLGDNRTLYFGVDMSYVILYYILLLQIKCNVCVGRLWLNVLQRPLPLQSADGRQGTNFIIFSIGFYYIQNAPSHLFSSLMDQEDQKLSEAIMSFRKSLVGRSVLKN